MAAGAGEPQRLTLRQQKWSARRPPASDDVHRQKDVVLDVVCDPPLTAVVSGVKGRLTRDSERTDVRRLRIRITFEDIYTVVYRGQGVGGEPIECPTCTRTIVRLEEDVHAGIRVRSPSQVEDHSHQRRGGLPMQHDSPGYRL